MCRSESMRQTDRLIGAPGSAPRVADSSATVSTFRGSARRRSACPSFAKSESERARRRLPKRRSCSASAPTYDPSSAGMVSIMSAPERASSTASARTAPRRPHALVELLALAARRGGGHALAALVVRDGGVEVLVLEEVVGAERLDVSEGDVAHRGRRGAPRPGVLDQESSSAASARAVLALPRRAQALAAALSAPRLLAAGLGAVKFENSVSGSAGTLGGQGASASSVVA